MIRQFDTAIFYLLNSFSGVSRGGDAAIRFCAVYLLYVMIAGATLFFAATLLPRFRGLRTKNTKATLFIIYSAFLARIAIAEPIRFLWHRDRPFEILAGVHQLVTHPNGASFPSGHASLAFGIAAAVYFYYPRTSIFFFFAAISIGVARVAAGVHWPSDIVGGAVVGIATVLIVHFVLKKQVGLADRDEETPRFI